MTVSRKRYVGTLKNGEKKYVTLLLALESTSGCCNARSQFLGINFTFQMSLNRLDRA